MSKLHMVRKLTVAVTLITLGIQAPGAIAKSCDQIKSHFFDVVKPGLVGAVTSSPIVAIGYRGRLSEVKKNSDPTKPEIARAYKLLVKDCNTRSDRNGCKKAAKRLRDASYAYYDQHRAWALAKCSGRLNIR